MHLCILQPSQDFYSTAGVGCFFQPTYSIFQVFFNWRDQKVSSCLHRDNFVNVITSLLNVKDILSFTIKKINKTEDNLMIQFNRGRGQICFWEGDMKQQRCRSVPQGMKQEAGKGRLFSFTSEWSSVSYRAVFQRAFSQWKRCYPLVFKDIMMKVNGVEKSVGSSGISHCLKEVKCCLSVPVLKNGKKIFWHINLCWLKIQQILQCLKNVRNF